ncbi:MAG: hypothetical protein C5S48_05125 [Candidatus Methanogaster sp.]|nr:MAG: hypothetical protein C5S48_05125 [ANME-2 cluster archaeon]
MPKNPTSCFESTIPSYSTARPSRDQIAAAQAGEEHWTGDFIFENEWQRVHTKKDRGLKLKTSFHECNPGRYKIVAKVMDIFGNDTMKITEVSV